MLCTLFMLLCLLMHLLGLSVKLQFFLKPFSLGGGVFDRVWPGLFGSLELPPHQQIKDSETSDLVSSIFVRVHKPCIKI